MKVLEIMSRDIKFLSPEMNAKEALEMLKKLQISGLPVLDSEGKLIGMFTEKEILSYILPSYIEKVGKFIYEENPKSVRLKAAELANLKVNQLMRNEVVTIKEDVTVCEVARMMLVQRARRIVVVDSSKKLVGMISRCDVVKALTEEKV